MSKNPIIEAAKSAAVRTIDMTPTWREVLPLLLHGYENGSMDGRKIAYTELCRMADLASEHVAAEAGRKLSAAEIEPARELIFKAERALDARMTDGQRRDLLKDNLPELSSHRIAAIVSALSLVVRPEENIGSMPETVQPAAESPSGQCNLCGALVHAR